jgi:hypothetical protein
VPLICGIRGPLLHVANVKGQLLKSLKYQKMKKIIRLFLFLLIFSSCQKEPELQEKSILPQANTVKTFTLNDTNDALARVLALSLTDKNVRLLLHSEIAKQFTYDFDILFDLIKNKEIESENYGLVKFSVLLQNIAREANIDFSMFNESSFRYKNLQISSPVYFENWNPEIDVLSVISLPVEYNEGEGKMVKAYDYGGNEKWVSEEEINSPILLVRQAERVDENGMMRVDPDGFVIPEEERVVTAVEAYEAANLHFKSAIIQQGDPVIEVLSKDEFKERLLSRRSLGSETFYKPLTPIRPVYEPTLKSGEMATIEAPGNFTVHPGGPYTIQLNWTPVAGAVSYEIFRQYQTNPNYLLATVGNDQINYFDQYLNIGDHYTYSIRAVDINGNKSVLTSGLEAYASWRNNGSRDIIDKIFLDSDCWSWCCGLFDGKIELQYKTSYLMTPSNTNVAYPTTGVNSVGQKTKDQQKNKWCSYNHYLFPWDLRLTSYSYRFILIEDDGEGNGKTIKLGTTFKIQLFKVVDFSVSPSIEFKIADKDEDFGEMIVQYWEWKNGPYPYTDGYNLMPDRGHARMYLKQ